MQIYLYGWMPGLNKVKLNKFLRRSCGLSLSQAKDVVDRVLEGEKFNLVISGSSDLADLSGIGVLYEVRK